MKIQELIDQLQEIAKTNPNIKVVRAKDDEGNGFDEIYSIEGPMGFEDGEIGYLKLTQDLIEEGYNEDDIAGPDARPVIVIW